MPLGPGVRYRMKDTSKGMVRLAFKGGKMVEAKNMKTGATHTMADRLTEMKTSGRFKKRRRK